MSSWSWIIEQSHGFSFSALAPDNQAGVLAHLGDIRKMTVLHSLSRTNQNSCPVPGCFALAAAGRCGALLPIFEDGHGLCLCILKVIFWAPAIKEHHQTLFLSTPSSPVVFQLPAGALRQTSAMIRLHTYSTVKLSLSLTLIALAILFLIPVIALVIAISKAVSLPNLCALWMKAGTFIIF